MKIDGKPYRTIWHNSRSQVFVLDQTRLPFFVEEVELKSVEDAARAIETMVIRGAPLIGVTAAYGVFLAMKDDASDSALEAAYHRLLRTRPTAVNLGWALDRMRSTLLWSPAQIGSPQHSSWRNRLPTTMWQVAKRSVNWG